MPKSFHATIESERVRRDQPLADAFLGSRARVHICAAEAGTLSYVQSLPSFTNDESFHPSSCDQGEVRRALSLFKFDAIFI